MYRRMAPRSSSLTEQSSSFTTCRRFCAISGERENVTVSVFLDFEAWFLCSSVNVARRLTRHRGATGLQPPPGAATIDTFRPVGGLVPGAAIFVWWKLVAPKSASQLTDTGRFLVEMAVVDLSALALAAAGQALPVISFAVVTVLGASFLLVAPRS